MIRFISFVRTDMKKIRRDMILSASILAPLLMIVVYKWILPLVGQWLNVNILLETLKTPIYLFILYSSPVMIGTMIAFLILDELDEEMVKYYGITPMGKKGYLLYRLFVPVIISSLMTLIAFIILDSPVNISPLFVILNTLFISFEAPIVTLLIVCFASNKVEGLALSKITSLLMIVPIVQLFIRDNYQIILSIFPPYWMVKLLTTEGRLSTYYLTVHIIGAIIIHTCYLLILFWKWNKKSLST